SRPASLRVAPRRSDATARSGRALLLDRDGALRAIRDAGAGLGLELRRHVGDLEDAVALVVGVEHVGSQHVATPVTGARLAVQDDLHDPLGGIPVTAWAPSNCGCVAVGRATR